MDLFGDLVAGDFEESEWVPRTETGVKVKNNEIWVPMEPMLANEAMA